MVLQESEKLELRRTAMKAIVDLSQAVNYAENSDYSNARKNLANVVSEISNMIESIHD